MYDPVFQMLAAYQKHSLELYHFYDVLLYVHWMCYTTQLQCQCVNNGSVAAVTTHLANFPAS